MNQLLHQTNLVPEKPGFQAKQKLGFQAKQLSSSLKSIQPNNSEVVQLITYTLIATAVVGIAVYHYIKQAEKQEN